MKRIFIILSFAALAAACVKESAEPTDVGDDVCFMTQTPCVTKVAYSEDADVVAIIAMPSVTNKGISKIANTLTLGAGVVTTRNHVHWVVTEYGAADLYGKSLQERAKALIEIAHPDHRLLVVALVLLVVILGLLIVILGLLIVVIVIFIFFFNFGVVFIKN